jgi:hypothetical protein
MEGGGGRAGGGEEEGRFHSYSELNRHCCLPCNLALTPT